METRFFLIVFIISAALGKAWASSAPADTIRLEEVVVTAGLPSLRDRSPAPMQQMDAAQLARVSGFSAAEALKGFSGVSLRDYGGIGGLKTVMVRSLGANHTAVMVDGHRLSDAASGQTDLGRIALQGIESLSLFVGQPVELLRPARYFAAASLIDIQSQDYKPSEQNTLAGFKTGSFGLLNPFLSSSMKISPRATASMQLNYTYAHGEYPFSMPMDGATRVRKNSDTRALAVGTLLRNRFHEHAHLEMNARYYNSQRGLPGAVILYNTSSTTQRLWNEDLSLNLRYQNTRPQRLQLLSMAGFSRSYLRYHEADYLNEQGELNNTYTQREYYVSQSMVYPLSGWLGVSLSNDFFVNTMEADLPGFAQPSRYTWLSHVAGKAQYGRMDAMASVLASFASDRTQQGREATFENALSPSFSMAYRLTSSEPLIRLRWMYKNIFRMPTFNDLYYTQVGNPQLDPEYATQFNAGVMASYRGSSSLWIAANADVFHNRVKDKIVAIPTKNLFVWSMQNIGMVNIRGLELQGRAGYDWTENVGFEMSLNYTLQRAEDVTRRESATYGHQIPYIPRETFSGSASADYQSLSAGWNSVFNGYRYVLGENIYENMLPSWWHHDVYLAWEIPWDAMDVKLRAEINNVLDRQYEVIKSFPMPGRAWYITLESRF